MRALSQKQHRSLLLQPDRRQQPHRRCAVNGPCHCGAAKRQPAAPRAPAAARKQEQSLGLVPTRCARLLCQPGPAAAAAAALVPRQTPKAGQHPGCDSSWPLLPAAPPLPLPPRATGTPAEFGGRASHELHPASAASAPRRRLWPPSCDCEGGSAAPVGLRHACCRWLTCSWPGSPGHNSSTDLCASGSTCGQHTAVTLAAGVSTYTWWGGARSGGVRL